MAVQLVRDGEHRGDEPVPSLRADQVTDLRALGAEHPELIPHGTTGGYGNWKCRCQECRAAWAAYKREYRRWRMAWTGEGR